MLVKDCSSTFISFPVCLFFFCVYFFFLFFFFCVFYGCVFFLLFFHPPPCEGSVLCILSRKNQRPPPFLVSRRWFPPATNLNPPFKNLSRAVFPMIPFLAEKLKRKTWPLFFPLFCPSEPPRRLFLRPTLNLWPSFLSRLAPERSWATTSDTFFFSPSSVLRLPLNQETSRRPFHHPQHPIT